MLMCELSNMPVVKMWISIYTADMQEQPTQKPSLFRTITVPDMVFIRSKSALEQERQDNLKRGNFVAHFSKLPKNMTAKERSRPRMY